MLLIAAVATPTRATQRCPSLSVAEGNVVECKVTNFSRTTNDTKVAITIFNGGGVVVEGADR